VADGPYAGLTIQDGLRIDLPDQIETIPNRAGSGGGAYSTGEAGRQLTLARRLDLVPAAASHELRLEATWEIPRVWGFGYVEVSVEGGPFVTLPDLDGILTDEDPFGNNDGFGLTGSGSGTLRFDLSPFVGRRADLRMRYHTYQGGPGTGWWIDRVALGEALVDDFDNGLARWVADGWIAVPVTLRHPQHYLVEWRNASGYDRSLLGAASTSFFTADEWRVEPVPANVPGALVMLRNMRYPLDGVFATRLSDPPSYGSKYGLLVVDPNFWPTARPSGKPFAGRLESLDAALSLHDQADFTLEVRDAETGELETVDAMRGTRGVSRFDDAFGYYPGFTTDAEGGVVEWDQDASVVLPSRGGSVYSSRVTHPDRSRPHPLDGEAFGGIHHYGSGNPGDENLGYGVHIEVVDQAPDGSWGALRVHNGAADYSLDVEPRAAVPGGVVTYTLAIRNRGAVALGYAYTVTLPAGFDHLGGSVPGGEAIMHPGSGLSGTGVLQPGTAYGIRHMAAVPSTADAAGDESGPARAAIDDGTDVWIRTAELAAPHRLYLPRAYRR
jgi:immune inhibitor A